MARPAKEKPPPAEKMRRNIAVALGIGFLLFIFFSAYRNTAARYAWRTLQRPDIALILVRGDAKLNQELGNYYFNNGAYDLAKAKKAFGKALAADPGLPNIHYQLARIYFVEGNLAAALEEINTEFRMHPENMRALYIRGLIQGHRGALEEAERDFSRFIAWVPKEWAGHNDLLWVMLRERKFKEAKIAAQTAFRKVPDAGENPWLWNNLAVAELDLETYASAAKSFEKAKTLAENITPAIWKKAYPGNDPERAGKEILLFKKTIEENLKRAQEHLSQPVDEEPGPRMLQ